MVALRWWKSGRHPGAPSGGVPWRWQRVVRYAGSKRATAATDVIVGMLSISAARLMLTERCTYTRAPLWS